MRPSLSKAIALFHSFCSLMASSTLVGVTTGGAAVADDDDDDSATGTLVVAAAAVAGVDVDASSLSRLLLLDVRPDEDVLRNTLGSMATGGDAVERCD